MIRIGSQWSQWGRAIAHMMATLCLWGLLAVGASAQAQGTSAGTDRVSAAHYPPLMISDQPEMPGLAIDILQAAADDLGRQIDLSFVPFQRALYQVKTRSDTLMPALFRNEEREADYLWVARIHAARLRFASLGAPISSLQEARALRRIVVEGGTSNERFLMDQGFDNLVRSGGPDASADMLNSGRVDAWFLTDSLAGATWERHDLGDSLVFGDVILELPIFLVAGPDFPKDLADAYREAIKRMRSSGALDAILDAYE